MLYNKVGEANSNAGDLGTFLISVIEPIRMPEYARLVPNIEDGRQFEIRSCGYLTDFEERANRLANSNKREGSQFEYRRRCNLYTGVEGTFLISGTGSFRITEMWGQF